MDITDGDRRDKLGLLICESLSMATLLANSVEERGHPNKALAKEQEEAVCYGAYELQAQLREALALFKALK